MANTQLYVLDEQQRLVPRGVMGELWIGGDGLAIDYWQRPDLTDAQFRTLPSLPMLVDFIVLEIKSVCVWMGV